MRPDADRAPQLKASVRRYAIVKRKNIASAKRENARSWETILRNASSVATILAAVVAIIAFYYGYKQFYETQKSTRETLSLQREALEIERESQAIDLYVKYNELMKDAALQMKL